MAQGAQGSLGNLGGQTGPIQPTAPPPERHTERDYYNDYAARYQQKPQSGGIVGAFNQATGNGPKPPRSPEAEAAAKANFARYGAENPRFQSSPIRVRGVDVDPNAYAYQGMGQREWNVQADQMARRSALQGNFAQADAMRAQQQAQLGQLGQTRQMYLDAAMGNAPSLAQAQLQQGVDRGIAGQMALANSARGSAAQRAAAMRGAQLQGQDMMAGLGAQAGALRAQEVAAARQGLLGADQATAQTMAGIRGADQGQAGMNLQAGLQSRQQNDAMMQALYGYGMQGAQGVTAGRQGAAQAQNQYDFNAQMANANLEAGHSAAEGQQNTQMAGAGMGALAAGLGALAMFSDKRAKKEIKRDDKEVDRFLKTLRPYSYEYKDKAHGEGRKTSVMAQDLEKTSLGETLVSKHANGLRQVDYAKALPVMLASMGRLSDRLEKAEARK